MKFSTTLLISAALFGIISCSDSGDKARDEKVKDEPKVPQIEYASEIEIKQDLDCGSGLSDEQKALNLRQRYKDKRAKFSGKIIRIDSAEITLYGALGTGIFAGNPKLYLKNANIVKEKLLLEEQNYNFDCKIVSHCEEGMFKNSLIFGDCTIVD